MGGPDFEPIFRPRFVDHFSSKSVDPSRALLRAPTVFQSGSRCGRPQPANDAPFAGTRSLPAAKLPLFLSHSRSLYATCDIHRFVACGRCLKAWPCQIGGERTTEGRWTSFRTNRFGGSGCDVFRRFSERPFASEPARHAAEPSIAAANGVSEDCENGSSLPPREAAHCCRAW